MPDRLCKCGHQLSGHTRDEGCPCGVEGCACKYFCEDSVPESSSVYSAWKWAADGYPGTSRRA